MQACIFSNNKSIMNWTVFFSTTATDQSIQLLLLFEVHTCINRGFEIKSSLRRSKRLCPKKSKNAHFSLLAIFKQLLRILLFFKIIIDSETWNFKGSVKIWRFLKNLYRRNSQNWPEFEEGKSSSWESSKEDGWLTG